MKTKMFRFVIASLTILFALAPLAMAETRLYVPRFQFAPDKDTQFLLVNSADVEADVDLWAFTRSGELLGQFRLHLNGRSTRSLTLSEAFGLNVETAGWVGVVSPGDGIQLSYGRIGDRLSESEGGPIAALAWSTQLQELTVDNPARQVLRISNPNSFSAQVILSGVDRTGRFTATRDVTVAPFGQIDAPIASVLAEGGRVSLRSNAQIISTLDDLSTTHNARREISPGLDFVEDHLDLIIDAPLGLGAYQVALRFDPRAVQFRSKDIAGGTSQGFDSRPLAVNIDNASGEITIASFQVGASLRGRLSVARLSFSRRANVSPRFGIRVDSAADEEGNTLALSDVAVGLVRAGNR